MTAGVSSASLQLSTPDHRGTSSELARLVRERDWSQTPLGAVEQWPQSLRTVVQILLTSRYAMWMGWGDELTFLYNDAYRPTLGIKHPWALGSPARQVWAEIWRDIGPRIETVLSTGEATYDEGLLLFLERSGFPEETYHTFSYSPLNDDTGRVNGMLCVVTEETERVIGERRMATLRDLGAGLAAAATEPGVLSVVTAQLAKNTKDLPFALVYLFDSQCLARRASITGLDEGHPLGASSSESDHAFPWPIDLFQQPRASLIEDLAGRSSSALPTGAWDKAPEKAIVVPIRQQGSERSAGVLVVGLNPYRRYDEAYAGFVELVAGQIAAGLASARAYEEERRRAEALAELDRAKTAFFSNVSHEFRTPLTLMLGPVEDILITPEDQISNENREKLQVAHRNGLRLQRLVNTLLDFSRIEAGRAQANYEPTDLAGLTADLASSFRSAMERAGLLFSVECMPLSQPVYVDHEMWEKIVLNLLSNAFKYTMDGSVTVSLVEAAGGAELSIRDSGPGIPTEELPRLFERFHRVEGTRGRTHEGTGIGLALVQELVRLHGGIVSVESTLGEGSVFTVAIPFGSEHLPKERLGGRRTLSSTALHAESYVEEALRWLPETTPFVEPKLLSQPGSPAAGTRSRVLVADDNADMRDYVRRLLSDRYEVVAAANGVEALRAALAHPPDLVLTDVMMPLLDGFGLLAALRANDKTKILPVLMLSARAGEESRVEGLAAGADDYVVKPFTARELLARVEAHLSLARMRKEAHQARQLSELRLGLALEATGLMSWQWDPVDDKVTTLGNAARIFGRDIVSSADGFRQIHPDDERAHRTKLEECARNGGSYYSELRLQPSGRESFAWLEERGTAITDDEGRVVLVVGVTADVTERKLMEQALRDGKDRLQQIFQQAPVAIIVVRGRDFIVELANPAYQALLKDRELIGRSLRQVAPDLGQEVWDAFNSVLDTGQPFVRDDFHVTYDQDGDGRFEDHWFNVVYHPLQEPDGSVSGLVAVCSEVTAQVISRRELERVNKELEEFAYVASHDLQEPIRMVNIYTQQILRRLPKQDEELAQYASFVQQGASRMRALISDLLTYSRTVQSAELPIGVANVSASLTEAMTVLESRIKEHGAVIFAAPLPSVCGDTAQLAHVFQNLISNSLKYRRPALTPEIDITAEKKGNDWVIAVRDNGIGFEQQFAERIFGLFKRLHKDEYPGTGLGLAICQRIVERYGGRIWAEGRPGDGATFFFALRAAEFQ